MRLFTRRKHRKRTAIPGPLESVSHEFVQEQRSDFSVKSLFELVSPAEDGETVTEGYFMQIDVVRKWYAQGNQFCKL